LVPVDVTDPTVRIVVPSEAALFRAGDEVEAAFACTDAGSGVASCEALDPVQVDTTGASHTFRARAVDRVGREATATRAYSIVHVDGEEIEGWFKDRATVRVTSGKSDVTFEVSLNGGPFQALGDGLVVDQTGAHHVDVRGSDGSSTSVAFRVDASPPTVQIDVPRDGQVFGVGEPVEAEFSCDDEGSGVASCTALDPVQLDTSGGERTFSVRAVDRVGHETVLTHTYTAQYGFHGFFPPVRNDATNVAKAGSTVPVKFRVTDFFGSTVSDPDVVASIVSGRVNCETGLPTMNTIEVEAQATNSKLIFDGRDRQFVFTWRTDRSWSGTCRNLRVRLADNTVHTALFQFR
jgi:hypothetical protein